MTLFSSRFGRLASLGVAGLALTLSAASADAQVRDRGDRYQRAQSDSSGRSRTRSEDNSRFERPSADFTRSRSSDYQRSDYRPPQRTVYQDRDRNDFRRVEPDYRDYDRGRSYRSYDNDRYRYNAPRYYEPRSSVSINVNYSRPYTYRRYDYIPAYRSYRHDYYTTYRPAYGHYDAYRPYYGSRHYYAPAPRVIYDYYPLGYDCAPIFGLSYGVRYTSHSYPRYRYPSSGLSFGIRYDYRR